MPQAQLKQAQAHKIPKVSLAKLGPNDDAEAFLTSFEHFVAAYHVQFEDWVYLLSPQLTDKALLAYTELHAEQTGSLLSRTRSPPSKICSYPGITQT